jgi:hypothetical protein
VSNRRGEAKRIDWTLRGRDAEHPRTPRAATTCAYLKLVAGTVEVELRYARGDRAALVKSAHHRILQDGERLIAKERLQLIEAVGVECWHVMLQVAQHDQRLVEVEVTALQVQKYNGLLLSHRLSDLE